MDDRIQGIVLRVVRYSDNASIATVWSWQAGRMSVLVPGGTSKEARRRRAIMMPLGQFEGVLAGRPGAQVRRLSEVRAVRESPAATGHPVRTVVAMFLAEFLCAVLKESQPDALLSRYLAQGIDALLRAEGRALANLHLVFLYHLGHYLGIEPDAGTYRPGRMLDLKDGRYVETMPMHRLYLMPAESRVAYVLSRVSWQHLDRLRFTRPQRSRALDLVMQYYGLHYTAIGQMPSLAIVQRIFD